MRLVSLTSIVIGLAFSTCLAEPTSKPAAAAAQMAARPATCPADLNAIAGQKGTHPRSADSFHFVVISDNTDDAQPGLWQQAVKEINLLCPDFVISIGDVIQGYTHDPQEVPQMWDQFDAFNGGFEAPYFFTPGNHDVSNALQIAYYTQRHGVKGKAYYSFDYKGCHFVVLNTAAKGNDKLSDFGPIAQEQLDWLKGDLTAARNAQHVFIFFHYPPWDRPELWNGVRALIDPAKTTVFNGHTHNLSYKKIDDVPVYVVGPTSAVNAQKNPDMGDYHMFAQVWVNQGQPRVAMVPVGALKPGEWVDHDFVAGLEGLATPFIEFVSSDGGDVKFDFRSTLANPGEVRVSLSAPGWEMEPEQADVIVPAGQQADASIQIKPQRATVAMPMAIFQAKATNPDGHVVNYRRETPIFIRRSIDIPPVQGIAIDGRVEDWKDVAFQDRFFMYNGAESWNGPQDIGAQWWVGHDDQNFYCCVKVRDDDVVRGEDQVKFFWNSRVADRGDRGSGERGSGATSRPSSGPSSRPSSESLARPSSRPSPGPSSRPPTYHQPGSGAYLFVTPVGKNMSPENEPVTPLWLLPQQEQPKGMKAVFLQRMDGYVFEFSLPLKEMGVADGSKMLSLDLQIDDVDDHPLRKSYIQMSASGSGAGVKSTSHYCRGTLK